MPENASSTGGASAWKEGILKRPLAPILIYDVGLFGSPGEQGSIAIETSLRLRLNGVDPNLTIAIAAAFTPTDNSPVIPPAPNAAQLRVRPWFRMPNGEYLFMRDLTLAPLVLPASLALGSGFRQGGEPVEIDYGIALGDGADIFITADPAVWADTGLVGSIKVLITAWYTGPWWDVQAISKLMGALKVDQVDPKRIATGGL